MLAVVSPLAYLTGVGLAAVILVVSCVVTRRAAPPIGSLLARLLALLLLADAVSYVIGEAVAPSWSARTSLPLALCNVVLVVAAAACWWRVPLLVEITYFIGLSATIQAVATPDQAVGYPHLQFFEYLVGHLGIVVAAIYLVVGIGLRPRPGAPLRVLLLAAAYTALVGGFDAIWHANYMFLAHAPSNTTLLSYLGPWPWYVLSAAGVAGALFVLLDLPFVENPGRIGYGLCAYVVVIVVGVPTWIAMFVVRDLTRRYEVLRRAGRLVTFLLAISMSVKGEIPSGDEPHIVVANHASFVDGLVMILCLEGPIAFVVSGGFARQRIAGPFLRALGSTFTTSETPRPASAFVTDLAAVLERGRTVVVFPEGGIAPDAGIGRFHLGAFVLAAQTRRPIVPIGISGTRQMLGRGRRLMTRGSVRVTIGAPCSTHLTGFKAAHALRDAARRSVIELSGEPDRWSGTEPPDPVGGETRAIRADTLGGEDPGR